MTTTSLDLNQVKDEFFKRYKTNIANGEYHQADLDRVKNDTNNVWMRSFSKHGMDTFDKTVGIMHDVLKWRKEFGANDLLIPGKYPFPEELFQRGAMFKKNVDKQSHTLLYLVVKTHKKGQHPFDQVCKFIAFFLEKEYRFNVEDPIVLCIDMYEAGYGNMDMEMILFVVNCLKTYYPGLIDYLIIFQMPFVFNAVWKIIKNMLPAETVKLVKFCDKKSIREFVNEDQLLVHMGGTDSYKYVYKPGMYAVKASPSSISLSQMNRSNENESSPTTANISESPDTEKSVRFDVDSGEEEKDAINRNDDLVTNRQRMETNTSSNNLNGMANGESTSSMATESRSNAGTLPSKTAASSSYSIVNGGDDLKGKTKNFDMNKATELSFGNELTTPLLSINPGDELVFNVKEGKSDIAQAIKLTNTSGVPLAYKIKITAPDKFRVKPGMGIIQTSACAQITINFLKEYHNSAQVHRDKFLILWTPINDSNIPSDINEFWKQVVQKKLPINEHKVKCIVSRQGDGANQKHNNSSATLPTSMSVQTFNAKSATSSSQNIGQQQFANSKAAKSMIGIESFNGGMAYSSKSNMGDFTNPSSAQSLNSLTSSGDEINSTITLLNSKLTTLELNTNSVVKSQQKMNRQFTIQLYLIYFLILLNLIQLLFQSNLYSDVIEPQIDNLLFQSKN